MAKITMTTCARIALTGSLAFLATLSFAADVPDSATATSRGISIQQPTHKGKTMPQQVTGAFDVKVLPQPADPAAAGKTIGRMLLDKKYHGPLDATGKGQMLAMRTVVDGSAGYVAMELVEGKLDGRSGSFVLQHSGTMNRGAALLALGVVPDSGTGELIGLSGMMEIIITGGKHSYRFDYSITEPH